MALKSKTQNPKSKGFTLLEIIVSVAIFAIILFMLVSSFSSMNTSNARLRADSQVAENAQRALEQIIFEIKNAKSIYTPTTTSTQLSLETTRWLPEGQTHTFIDFFACGDAICFKRELQDAVAITSNTVKITNLNFLKILTAGKMSVKVSFTATYTENSQISSSISVDSTASLRNYE